MASQTVTETRSVARVNLLPPEIAEQIRVRRVQSGLVAGLVLVAALVGLLYLVQVGKVNDAEAELEAATAQRARLTAERAELQTVADTYARVAAKEAVLRAALARDIAWSGYLNDLMLTIPDNVWLTSMTAAQAGASRNRSTDTSGSIGSVTFSGTAFDHDDVATWLEVLARQRGYANPYFSNSTESLIGTRKVYNFTSTVTLTDAALSNRANRLLGG